jgi:hypothetical protein
MNHMTCSTTSDAPLIIKEWGPYSGANDNLRAEAREALEGDSDFTYPINLKHNFTISARAAVQASTRSQVLHSALSRMHQYHLAQAPYLLSLCVARLQNHAPEYAQSATVHADVGKISPLTSQAAHTRPTAASLCPGRQPHPSASRHCNPRFSR